MEIVREIILGEVVGKANHYMAVPDGKGGRRIIKDDKIRAYERTFFEQCHVYRGRKINVHFSLSVDVWYSSPRFDLDNSLKTILDCLQYCDCITDDNLCFSIDARKHLTLLQPRVELTLEPLEPMQGELF